MTQTAGMVSLRQELGRVRDYYCTRRAVDGQRQRSIYEIWEAGEAFNDSVTPSTYCPDYRSHMMLKILSLTGDGDRVFSLGCGNAFVEGDLVRAGRPVQAIDCNPEAVHLAAGKGLEAFTADFFDLPNGALMEFDVVYADGFLGHVFQAEDELTGFFHKLAMLAPPPGCWLVLSNDAPLSREALVEPHPRVEDFWLLSRRYLDTVLGRFGFETSEQYYFPYQRPISGLRNRTICIARVPGADRMTG